MQAQNDLAVSSCWWYCGGHKDLQGLRSDKSEHFPQTDFSRKKLIISGMPSGIYGFICKTEVEIATAKEAKDQHSQPQCVWQCPKGRQKERK